MAEIQNHKLKVIDFFCGDAKVCTPQQSEKVIDQFCDFDDVEISPDWAFEDFRSTEQWTHGYHRYPAKFLPNVVKKIIEEYSPSNCNVIADLFAGCGTTLVEAKAHGIKSIGTDINPVAKLITKVKTTPIPPEKLDQAYNNLISYFDKYFEEYFSNIQKHEKLDYWFLPSEKSKIAFLYDTINCMDVGEDIKDFFYVSVSHILKNCSRWLQSSTKPQVDKKKDIPDPFDEFIHHCKKMINSNKEYFDYLTQKKYLNVPCKICLEDARHTSIESQSVDMIITSPPYVTSYEYADIHQLTAFWMDYVSNLPEFRKQFIGTSYSHNSSLEVPGSAQAQEIVNSLTEKNKRIAKDVALYFNDMQKVAFEMARILVPNGHACIVIGNTKIKDIQIKSAEVFCEFLQNAGLSKENVIKRSIPHKLMPTLRDKITGKFTKLDNPNCKKVYPNEYVIIMRK